MPWFVPFPPPCHLTYSPESKAENAVFKKLRTKSKVKVTSVSGRADKEEQAVTHAAEDRHPFTCVAVWVYGGIRLSHFQTVLTGSSMSCMSLWTGVTGLKP